MFHAKNEEQKRTAKKNLSGTQVPFTPSGGAWTKRERLSGQPLVQGMATWSKWHGRPSWFNQASVHQQLLNENVMYE